MKLDLTDKERIAIGRRVKKIKHRELGKDAKTITLHFQNFMIQECDTYQVEIHKYTVMVLCSLLRLHQQIQGDDKSLGLEVIVALWNRALRIHNKLL